MPKGRKAKKAPPPSDTSSLSEESASPPSPPRRRQTVPRRANPSSSKGKGPARRASIPGEVPSDSDNEPPRRSTARSNRPVKSRRPASSDEDGEEEEEDDQRSKRPQPKKGSRREGRDGRALATRRPKKPVEDDVSDDDDDDPRSAPRRTKAKGKAPARDEDSEDDDDDPAPAPRRKVAKGKARMADDDKDDDDEPKPALRRKALLGRAPGADADERPRPSSSRRRQTTSSSHREPSAMGIDPATHESPNDQGEVDEDYLKALALSQQDHQPAQSSVVDDFEEQLRRAMEESQQVQDSRTPAPAYVDDDQALRHWLEVSEQEHQAQIRKRQDREEEEERKFQEQLNEVMRASENTVPALYLAAERELENVRQSSHETHSKDVQRAAEQMPQERTTTQRSASWTEAGMAAFQSGESSSSAPPTPAPVAATPDSTARTPQRKKSVIQRLKTSVSGSKKKPRRSSTLVTIPERPASAGPSTPSPLRTTTNNSSAVVGPSTLSRSQTITTKPPSPAIPSSPSSPSSQSLMAVTKPQPPSAHAIALREPPIKPEDLIALCEKAFPIDPAMAAALANSKQTAAIEHIQNASEEYDPQMAAVLAESAAEHAEGIPDISETGLEDRSTEYNESSNDRILNHGKYTSSNYRQGQPGGKKLIDKEILNIMRLYRDLLEWNNAQQPEDRLMRKYKHAQEGEQRIQAAYSAIAAPKKLGADTTITTSPTETTDIDLDTDVDVSRPALRAEVGGAPSAAAQQFMASTIPATQKGRVSQMQSLSTGIRNSQLPRSRPRAKPEAHMNAFARLPIQEEEQVKAPVVREEGMSGETARRVRRDRGFRRSGI